MLYFTDFFVCHFSGSENQSAGIGVTSDPFVPYSPRTSRRASSSKWCRGGWPHRLHVCLISTAIIGASGCSVILGNVNQQIIFFLGINYVDGLEFAGQYTRYHLLAAAFMKGVWSIRFDTMSNFCFILDVTQNRYLYSVVIITNSLVPSLVWSSPVSIAAALRARCFVAAFLRQTLRCHGRRCFREESIP